MLQFDKSHFDEGSVDDRLDSWYCRYDEVSMLENNLKELQLEYRRGRSANKPSSSAPYKPPSSSSPSSDLSPSSSSPYSNSSPTTPLPNTPNLYSQSSNPFDSSPAHPSNLSTNHVEYESFNLNQSESMEDVGEGGGLAARRAADLRRRSSAMVDSTKPVLEEMATRN